MEFRSLSNKSTSGDGRIVMTEPYILFKEDVDVMLTHEVTYDELCRPDLIALNYYQDQSMTEIILKFNGISNPFAMNEGDYLEIPIPVEQFQKFVKPSRNTGSSKKDKFVAQRRLTTKDAKRLEYLQGISEKGALPPNRLKENERNVIMRDGITDLNGTRPTESRIRPTESR